MNNNYIKLTYAIILTKVLIFSVVTIAVFMQSLILGGLLLASAATGLALQYIREKQAMELEQKLAGEFMQALASRTGQGSC